MARNCSHGVVVAARVAPDVANLLEARAVAGDRTISQEVRRALRAYLLVDDAPAAGLSSTDRTPAREAV